MALGHISTRTRNKLSARVINHKGASTDGSTRHNLSTRVKKMQAHKIYIQIRKD